MPLSFRLLTGITALSLCLAQSAIGSTEQALFNGKDFSGWRFFSREGTDLSKACVVKDDVIQVAGKPVGYLVTTEEYENYSLHLEWRAFNPKFNGGVLVHQIAPDVVWPTCMQVQMKVGAVGELIPMINFKQAEQLAPNAKSLPRSAKDQEKPVGEWNTLDIVCSGDSIECSVNGVLVNRATRCQPSKGWIGIQLEGMPFEMRKVTLKKLTPKPETK